MPDETPIPEIVVTEQRQPAVPDIIPGVNIPAGPGFTRFAGLSGQSIRNWRDSVVGAFLAPAAVPSVIEEIIVTAPRPGTAQVASTAAEGLSRWGLPLAIAGAVGLTAREIMDELGEQMLEDAWQRFIAPDRRRTDTPVLPMQPEALPEVTVTAKRPFPQVAPAPIFFPDRFADPDPWVMQPIVPRQAPTRPLVEVAPGIATPTAPEIAPAPPATVPRIAPFIVTSPFVSTSPRVGVFPEIAPQTQTWIATQPATQPLTQVNPLVQSYAGTQAGAQASIAESPLAQTLPQGDLAGGTCICPPCAKDEEQEEMRSQCFKKLVKEGLFPSFDESFDWVEIDCVTGREL